MRSSPPLGLAQPGLGAAAQLHDLRLRLLVQQESEQVQDHTDLDLSVVQALPLLVALLAAEDQAGDAERRGDTEQAMGWFADSIRLRDVIGVVSSIEIPARHRW